MKVKIAMAFLALFMFAGTAGLATAQDTTKTTHKKTRTLSGCLQTGDDANEYKLTTAKGGTWEIKRAIPSSSAIMSVIRLRLPAWSPMPQCTA
jgi:hypothetical protein